LFESVDEMFPPVVVLGEDYEGCKQSVAGGETKGDLLEVDESLDGVLVVRILNARETVVCPTSVNCRECE
jgi:hypothetical protein